MLRQSRTSSWALLYKLQGLQRAIDQMCSFYSNLAIICALLGGFSIATFLDKPEDIEGTLRGDFLGCSGMLTFVAFLAGTLVSILIDNTVKQIPSGAAFVNFLSLQGGTLATPTHLFILGSVLCFLDMFVHLSIAHSWSVLIVVGSAIERK